MRAIEFMFEAGGVGRVIPGVNTTADVGPYEIQRQAAKLGMTTDRDGIPPLAQTNGKLSLKKKGRIKRP